VRSTCMDAIPGWADLIALVGAVPVFADAPILDFSISLTGDASLVLRTWVMCNDEYDYQQPVVVQIRMCELQAVELDEFAPTAVIDELKIERADPDWVVSVEPAVGLRGTLRARQITIQSSRGHLKESG
jgi:hypothetical protein